MSNVLPFPLSKKQALIEIRAMPSVRVFFPKHARERMTQRSITRPDVMGCLQSGNITEGPGLMPGGQWRMTLSWFRAGHPLIVVVELDVDDDGSFAVVVTTID